MRPHLSDCSPTLAPTPAPTLAPTPTLTPTPTFTLILTLTRCGEQAQHILSVTLAAPRRRQVEKLVKWWGFGPAELEHFRDEVRLTP